MHGHTDNTSTLPSTALNFFTSCFQIMGQTTPILDTGVHTAKINSVNLYFI